MTQFISISVTFLDSVKRLVNRAENNGCRAVEEVEDLTPVMSECEVNGGFLVKEYGPEDEDFSDTATAVRLPDTSEAVRVSENVIKSPKGIEQIDQLLDDLAVPIESRVVFSALPILDQFLVLVKADLRAYNSYRKQQDFASCLVILKRLLPMLVVDQFDLSYVYTVFEQLHIHRDRVFEYIVNNDGRSYFSQFMDKFDNRYVKFGTMVNDLFSLPSLFSCTCSEIRVYVARRVLSFLINNSNFDRDITGCCFPKLNEQKISWGPYSVFNGIMNMFSTFKAMVYTIGAIVATCHFSKFALLVASALGVVHLPIVVPIMFLLAIYMFGIANFSLCFWNPDSCGPAVLKFFTIWVV